MTATTTPTVIDRMRLLQLRRDLVAARRRVTEARGAMRRGDPNTTTVCGACRTGESRCCDPLGVGRGR